MGPLGLLIETLVSVLLTVTIVYCVTVSRKLERLRTDQTALRDVVRELTSATGQAQAAITGLRDTVSQAESSLMEKLESAQQLEARLMAAKKGADNLIARLKIISRQASQRTYIFKDKAEDSEASRRNPFDFGQLAKELAANDEQGRDAA